MTKLCGSRDIISTKIMKTQTCSDRDDSTGPGLLNCWSGRKVLKNQIPAVMRGTLALKPESNTVISNEQVFGCNMWLWWGGSTIKNHQLFLPTFPQPRQVGKIQSKVLAVIQAACVVSLAAPWRSRPPSTVVEIITTPTRLFKENNSHNVTTQCVSHLGLCTPSFHCFISTTLVTRCLC